MQYQIRTFIIDHDDSMSNILERIDQTTIYTQPIFFVLITTTNILNICILRSPVLRSSPCTYYFLAYSVFSIIYTVFLCPLQILRRFSIPWTDTPSGCRMQNFLLFTLALQTKLMLTLASFDRFCSSAKSARLRSLSAIRIARLTITVAAIFSVVYMLPMLIIYYYDTNSNTCRQYLYKIVLVYTSSQVIIYYVSIPVLMIIFGLLTIHNIRQPPRYNSVIIATSRNRRSEGQLARMLLLQVGVHMIYSFPFGIIYIMNSFAPSTRTVTIIAIRQASVPWLQCDYFMFFFLYILSASIYRQELLRLFKLKRHCNRPKRTRRTTKKHTNRPMLSITIDDTTV
jgi:hypothetical protein